jgi:hypothetical protein
MNLLFAGRKLFRFISSIVTLLLMAGGAWGQSTARLNGTVKDASGGMVAGASVTLTNEATNVSRTTKTDGEGNYLFSQVPVGTYRLTIERDGFKKHVQSGITLELNQNGRSDVTLDVGQATEVIEVSAGVPQVDTTGAMLGKVEDTKRIEDLPLVDRDTLQLGLLQAGVFAPDPDDGSGNPFSVSGQRSESLTFLLDGADNTNFLSNNIVVSPNPDAVAEFKILTNNYDAEFGRSSGGIVNQVIKSGTNQLHGSGFEFLRNTVLNAKDFFLPERSPFQRNVFGGTMGGPIKRDKIFIFGAYQGARRREGETAGLLTVLTPSERGGNFSDLLNPNPNAAFSPCPNPGPGDPVFEGGTLFNPATTTTIVCANPDSQGNPVKATSATPYAGNIVPVNPISATYINKYLPFPNVGSNGFLQSSTAATDDDQGIVRVDYNISRRDTLSGLYIIDDLRDALPFQINHGASTGGNVPLGSGLTDTDRRQVLTLTWTHSFARGWINELRGSANRDANLQAKPTDTTTPAELGFTNVNPDNAPGAAPPIMFTPGFNLGPSPQGPTSLHDMTYQVQDHVTIPHGRHEWKFGVDIRRIQNNFNFDFFNNGSYTFGNASGGPFAGSSFTGSGLADFVGGFPGNFFQFSNAVYNIRSTSQYYYAQDTYKVTPRLTLNLGVRYEYNSPQYDTHNNIIGFFGPNAQSTVFPDAPPGILYPGDPGTPNRALVYPDKNNFAPRVGFAWDVMGNAKLVVRGGGGIFYDIEDGALNLQFGGQPPFGSVSNLNPQPSDVSSVPDFLTDPFTPLGLQNPYPFASRGLTGTFFIPNISFAFVTDPHFRTPYSENFNLGFQYQLDKNTAIEAVYVGSLGRKLISSIDVNPPQPSIENAQLNSPAGFVNEDCARQFAGCADPTDPNSSLQKIGQLLTNKSIGMSASNGLQVTVDRRYSHGLSFRAAYTFSKTMDQTSGFRARSSTYTDPFDTHLDYGLADFDATHRFVFSGSWEIPIGQRLTNNKLAKQVLGGWQANVITTFQSGQPITLYSNNDNSFQGNFLDRPDRIGNIQTMNARNVTSFSADAANCSGASPDPITNNISGNFYFNPTAFDCLSPGNNPIGSIASFGNLGRNTIRGPGINNWDISFLKSIKIKEAKSLEFRAEFFNAFNHAQFLNPDNQGFSGTFGMISQDRGPRIIQFGLKFYF